jgi:hypothetical protein
MISSLGEHHIVDGRGESAARVVLVGHSEPEYFIAGRLVDDIAQVDL